MNLILKKAGFPVIEEALVKDKQDCVKFTKKLKVFTLAESLGGVESLVNHPATMTHASMPKKDRERNGITESLIRLSVGIEDSADLINDLDKAIN